MSHKNILRKVIEDQTVSDNDLILIFEDDVFFNNSFKNDLINIVPIVKKIDPNFILYIGGRFTENFKPSSLNEWEYVDFKLYNKKGNHTTIKSLDHDRTTHAIILTKFACKEIINKTKDVSSSIAIDFLYQNIRNYVPNIKIYDVFSHLCYSPMNYKSDIQTKM